jgi:hypothetical protein
MVHHLLQSESEVAASSPGYQVNVVPLKPWTWAKPDILKQLEPKPEPTTIAPEDIPDPSYHVSPVPYYTGFKTGQLMKLNFPISKSSFL